MKNYNKLPIIYIRLKAIYMCVNMCMFMYVTRVYGGKKTLQ